MIRFFVSKLMAIIRLYFFNNRWRKKNARNETIANSIFNIDSVVVGDKTYGCLNILSWGHKNEFLNIGSYVSISNNVTFILGGNHVTSGFMTYPVRSKIGLGVNKNDAYSKGSIIIENDVWIGFGVTILSGLTIGKGSIIAAGSVVTKSFPPYSVIGGNPAIKIRDRFDASANLIMANIDVGTIDISKLNAEQVNILYEKPSNENKIKLGL